MNAGISEAGWQEQVIDAARIFGWHHLHVRRSIGKGRRWTTSTNVIGWPDLWLWKPGCGFIALELKVHPKKPTPEQLDVLEQLQAAGARAMVAYPDQLDDVIAMFRSPARAAA